MSCEIILILSGLLVLVVILRYTLVDIELRNLVDHLSHTKVDFEFEFFVILTPVVVNYVLP